MSIVNPKTALMWLAAALTITTVLSDPSAHLIVIGSAWLMSLNAEGGGSFKSFFRLGMVILLIRVTLMALMGHGGDTTVLVLPKIAGPEWLGGLQIGGRISAEVLASSLSEGLQLVVVLTLFGAFLALVSSLDLIKFLPRFLFYPALIVNIAVSFAPNLAISIRDIKEAQQMRGLRGRGWGIRSIFFPTLASALEGSVALAESMESRGFGAVDPPPLARRLIAAALPLVAATGIAAAFWTMGLWRKMSLWVMFICAALSVVILRMVSQLIERTSYRPSPSRTNIDLIHWIYYGSVLLSAVGLDSAGYVATYDPYSHLIPPFDLPSLAIATSLVIPALLRRRMPLR